MYTPHNYQDTLKDLTLTLLLTAEFIQITVKSNVLAGPGEK